MQKYLLGFIIVSLSMISVSFADFRSETEKCGANKSCATAVRKKYTVSKAKACAMKDGKYELLLETKRPGLNSQATSFFKDNGRVFYIVNVRSGEFADPFGTTTDRSYLYMRDCESKNAQDIGAGGTVGKLNLKWGGKIIQVSKNIVVYAEYGYEGGPGYGAYDFSKKKTIFRLDETVKGRKAFQEKVFAEYKSWWYKQPSNSKSDTFEYGSYGAAFILEGISKDLKGYVYYTPSGDSKEWKSKKYPINLLTKTITLAK